MEDEKEESIIENLMLELLKALMEEESPNDSVSPPVA